MTLKRLMSPLAVALMSAAMVSPSQAVLAKEPLPATQLSTDAGLLPKEGKNLSGAACAPNGPCLLVGDEMRFARLFTLSPGMAQPQRLSPGEPLYLLPGSAPDDPETDVEGVAHADGIFFIVGSHSRNKTGQLQPPRHLLYRIAARALTQSPPTLGTADAVSPDVQRISLDSIILAHPFEAEPLLRPPGEGEHGLNIEGVAVRGNDLVLGFRGPVNEAGALVLQLNLDLLYAGIPQTPQAYRVPLRHGDAGVVNEQGIRDIAPVQGGYLILSGREMRVEPERSDIYFWVPGQPPAHLGEIASQPGSPEAIAVLDESGSAYRLLILSDGPAGGNPRILRVPKPSQSHSK